MRQVMRLVATVMLGLSAVACSSGDDVRSDPGPEPRDTSTVDPEKTKDEADAESTTTTAVPVAEPSTSPMLAVVGSVVVPDGTPGELSVVMVGRPDPGDRSGTVPVVVRNRTDDTINSVEASATARAEDGSLAGSGSSQGFAPSILAPGEWAFGYLYFGADLPDDATFDVTATGETDDEFLGSVDVLPVETNVVPREFTGQQVVGIVANETDAEVSGPISVDVVCFDASGTTVTGSRQSFTDSDTIAPGGTASFSVDLFDDPCPNYAVGASGFDF